MNFGFSYVGLAFLAMLIVPNLLWIKRRPQGYEKYAARENKALLALERAGEALAACTALIFSDFNVSISSGRIMWLAAALAAMILYEVYWIRYFRSRRTMKDFYSGLFGIPVAGATLPVCAFLLLGIYGRNIIMIISAIILGVGHIGIHLAHRKEAE